MTITATELDVVGESTFNLFVQEEVFGGLLSADITVDITQVNDAPVAGVDSAITEEDTFVLVDVLANDEDVEGGLTIDNLGEPANGVVEIDINAEPKLKYTPNENFNGVDSFSYSVVDEFGAIGVGTVTVTVNAVNDEPTIDSDAVTTVDEDGHYIYIVDANDVEDNTLAFELTTSPEGMNVNEEGVISWIPTNEQVGSHDVVLQVSDSNEGTATQTFVVDVANSNDAPTAPVLTEPIGGVTLTVDSGVREITLKWEASSDADPTSDTITYEVFHGTDTLESVGTTEGTELVVTVEDVASQEYSWYVSATDGTDTTDSITESYVAELHTAPSIVEAESTPTEEPVVVEEGTLQQFTVAALESDIPGDLPLVVDWQIDEVDIFAMPGNSYDAVEITETFDYTPAAGDRGPHTITAIVTDSTGMSAEKSWDVEVTALNREPVMETIEAQTVDEDVEIEVEVTVEDADIELGDTIDFSIGNEDIDGITITKDHEEEDTATATIRWTPTNDDVGVHEIIVNIKDEAKAGESQTFTITVENVNDAPTITDFSPEFDAAIGDETIEFSVTFEDVDAVDEGEEDPVNAVWTVEWADSIVDVESERTSTITVNGADITETGTYDISVVVSDGSEDTAEHSWRLRVDDKPVSVGNMFRGTIFSIPEAELGAATGVTIEESDFGKIDFGDNELNLVGVVDIDNVVRISKGRIGIDTSRYDAFDINAGDETPITLTMDGLSLTVAPEEIYHTSVFGDLDRGSVCGACEIVSFDNGELVISVPGFSEYFIPDVNREPVASAGEDVTVFEDDEVTLFGSGSVDPEGTDLTYEWTQDSGPTVSLSSATATNPKFTPTEVGDYVFSLVVSDGELESEEATVTVTVIESNLGQVLSIRSVDVKSSGTDDELKPGEDLTVVVKVENKDNEINLNDVDLDLWFEDDEGNKLEDEDGDILEEEEEFDLDNDESDSFTFEFNDITLDVEDGDKYTIHVTVVGEDEDNRTMKYRDEDSSEEIEFVREKHEVELFDISVNPNIVRCSRNLNFEASVRNVGKDDSEEVTLTVESAELGIDESEEFELDDDLDDDDSVGDIDFNVNVGSDVEAGFYLIDVEATYHNGKTETEQAEVEVEDCMRQGSSQEGEAPRVERAPFVPPITSGGAQVSQEPVTISFRDSSAYAVLLISGFIIITGLVIFAFGAMIIMATRRR